MRRIIRIIIILLLFSFINVYAEDKVELLDNMIDKDFFINHESVMLVIDSDTCNIVEANNAAVKFYGYSKEELVNMSIDNINTLPKEELEEKIRLASEKEENEFTFKHSKKNGETRDVEVHSYPFNLEDKVYLHSIIYDVTDIIEAEKNYRRAVFFFIILLSIFVLVFIIFFIVVSHALSKEKKIKEMLEYSESNFESLFNNMHEGYALHEMIKDDDGNYLDYKFLKVNKSFEKYTGLKAEDIIGKTALGLLPNLEKEWIENYGRIAYEGESISFTNYSRDVDRHFSVHGYNAGYGRFITVLIDITEAKEKQEKIEYLSMHDQLTGLYNRRFIEDEFIKLDIPSNLPLSIIMADVNGLKMINDAFGHDAGDRLLIEAAKTMKDVLRDDDIIARIGGDEFLILLPSTSREIVLKMLERLKVNIKGIKIGPIQLSISFGDATKSSVSEDLQVIYKKSEDSMYRSKLNESNILKNNMISVIMESIRNNYPEVYDHTVRVGNIALNDVVVAFSLSDDDSKKMIIASKFHDIGMISIDEEILRKPKALNDEEWKQIKQHSEKGYRILSSINEYSEAANVVLAHHERWDGKGYPKNLREREIPYLSRILCVIDSYDAMINDSVYSRALSKEEAVLELKRCSGTQFDPDVVNIFVNKVLTD